MIVMTLLKRHHLLGILVTGLLLSPLAGSVATAQKLDPNDEYIILSGGPALLSWEGYRREEHQHDRWWGNFVRTARIRMQQLQEASNGAVNITWMVYKRGYAGRATEDGEPLISHIESVRDKFKVNLVWYDTKMDVINYINKGQNRRVTKVSGFEYFGHSNKYCFLLDYSNHVLGASRTYLHQSDLRLLDRDAFARKAYCKSWGCHSGESFSAAWRKATGQKMIGAIGKTDYSESWKIQLPHASPGGRWTN